MKTYYKVFGIITLVAIIGFSFAACSGSDGGGGGGDSDYIPPEDRPIKDRWGKWVDPSSTATLDYSVTDDEVCTITVGGTAESSSAYKWKANAGYSYTAKANTCYDYTFEAWTQSGSRYLTVQYYADNDEGNYLYLILPITNTRTPYTVKGLNLPKGGACNVEFQCADQLGTFYVKILEIKGYSLDGTWVKNPMTLIVLGSSYTSKNNGTNYGKGIISYDSSILMLNSTHAWNGSSWDSYLETVIAEYTLSGTTIYISSISSLNPSYSAFLGSWKKQ